MVTLGPEWGSRRSLFGPCLDKFGDILSFTWKTLTKPYKKAERSFQKLNNAGLYFCGFSIILVPVLIVHWAIIFGIILAELGVQFVLLISLGLIYVLAGIWPAFIISFGFTGITMLRLPLNMYYHCLVTFRTVMLRRSLKIVSFLLLPLVHLLVPPVTFIVCLFTLVPWFAAISFVGYPIKTWSKIKPYHGKFWKKCVTDMKNFARNYGHPSGIPRNWDGKIYGLPIDPTTVIISVLLYLVAVLPVSISVLLIFAIKAVPIFLETLREFSKMLNFGKAVRWYQKVLGGSQVGQPSPAAQPLPAGTPQSGHVAWSKPLKKSMKQVVKAIEGYGKMPFFEKYGKIISKHSKLILKLDPSKLLKIVTSYAKDFSPLRLIEEDVSAAAWLIMWIPLLFSSIMWILGLVLVLSIPPCTFLLGLLAWLALWIPVLVLPPLLYIAGWIFIIFGLPVLYILVWVLVLAGPWAFSALGLVSGPLLALNIPFKFIYKNIYNPLEMWSGIKQGLLGVPEIIHSVDRVTGNLSLGKIKFFKADSVFGAQESKRVKIAYWDLYISRCKEEARKIQTQGWMLEEDILAASSAAMIAIPGVTILALLTDSVNKNKKDRTLIFWNEDTRCRDSTRDVTDNVANLFWPQLMQVKEGLLGVTSLDSSSLWIGASLCDGEDEKTEALATALKALSADKAEHKKCLQIRASIENIVHALLRVQAFSSRLPEIFSTEEPSSRIPDVMDVNRMTAEEEEELEVQTALMASMQDNIENDLQDNVMQVPQAPLADTDPESEVENID